MKQIKYILLLLAIIMIIGAFFFSVSDFSIERNNKIGDTANQITEIKRIGQWEFLTVECETLVDTLRRRPFPLPDDRLARIYNGTLRLGIDLAEAGEDWIQTQGDTLVALNLPPIKLLDEKFIDEAITTTFYESGSFGPNVKSAMRRKAALQMKAFALTPTNIDNARAQAIRRFTLLFHSLGFTTVQIKTHE